jgi:hypothetical protein
MSTKPSERFLQLLDDERNTVHRSPWGYRDDFLWAFCRFIDEQRAASPPPAPESWNQVEEDAKAKAASPSGRLACSRCGVEVPRSYAPGLCVGDYEDGGTSNEHDQAEGWEEVNGDAPTPAEKASAAGDMHHWQRRPGVNGWACRKCSRVAPPGPPSVAADCPVATPRPAPSRVSGMASEVAGLDGVEVKGDPMPSPNPDSGASLMLILEWLARNGYEPVFWAGGIGVWGGGKRWHIDGNGIIDTKRPDNDRLGECAVRVPDHVVSQLKALAKVRDKRYDPKQPAVEAPHPARSSSSSEDNPAVPRGSGGDAPIECIPRMLEAAGPGPRSIGCVHCGAAVDIVSGQRSEYHSPGCQRPRTVAEAEALGLELGRDYRIARVSGGDDEPNAEARALLLAATKDAEERSFYAGVETVAKGLAKARAEGYERGKAELAATLQRIHAAINGRAPHDRMADCIVEWIHDAKERIAELDAMPDPGFGVDPEDSQRLCALRQAIDDHLGWANDADEEAADYVARVVEVGAKLKRAPTLAENASVATDEELRAECRAADGDDAMNRALYNLGMAHGKRASGGAKGGG